MSVFECKADYFHLMHIKINYLVVLDKKSKNNLSEA